MDLQKIIKTIQLVGFETPAFKALFDVVVGSLNEKDAGQLKDIYERSYQRAKLQHEEAQKI